MSLSNYHTSTSEDVLLPSGGIWYTDVDVEFKTIEPLVSVRALTARDELTLSNPTKLLNGTGVSEVIESCCPNVKNAWVLSAADAEAILLAIRLASRQKDYNLNVQCPECGQDGLHTRDIQNLVDRILPLTIEDKEKYKIPLSSGVVLQLKPNTLKSLAYGFKKKMALTSLAANEEVLNSLPPEEVMKNIKNIGNELCQMELEIMFDSIENIELPDERLTKVYDAKEIKSFLMQLPSSDTKAINKALEPLAELGIPKVLELACHKCSYEWDQKANFYNPQAFS
ncbi:hypothetical protein [Endozoicomonas sp. SCSIO W0465]|uniref:T4 family baseplate hub assembly chaperone n=1 Tax=Endozoicomonas sp. SCSIO W0465 TaxID=2918516 RepID=UPI0020760E74|nr:hypothetical protein [Endozoicomonas sp. SCSIO W0465]USE39527.1 hypothetical protein MJO57_15995 [Endozoicomonas sp. SCSIO W0465]